MSIPVSAGTASKISDYWKTVVAVTGVLVTVGAEVVQAVDNGAADGTLDTTDMVKIAIIIMTAIGVYAKQNTRPPSASYDPTVSEAEVSGETTEAGW